MDNVTTKILVTPHETMMSESTVSLGNGYCKCRKCRYILFSGDYIVNAHGKQLDGEELTSCDALSRDQTVLYLRDALPSWIEDLINEANWIKGKIMCPKCNGRVGSFDFVSGTKCPCGQHVLPAVHVVHGKIDWEKKTTRNDLTYAQSVEVIEKHETELLKEHEV